MKKNVLHRALALICSLTICVGLLAGCSTKVVPTSISSEESELKLKPRETTALGYSIEVQVGDNTLKFDFPQGAEMTANEDSDEKVVEAVRGFIPTWASSDENIVTVDETGFITAVAEGNAVITLSLDKSDISTEVAVTVALPEVESIEVEIDLPVGVTENEDGKVEVPVGGTFSVKPKLYPEDVSGDNAKLTYESTDAEVATVDDEGVVTSVAGGECIIVITAPNGVKLEIPVRVVVVPTDIKLSQGEGSLNRGYGHQLTATVEPEEMDLEYTIVWSSSDESVATVDQTGYVKAVAKGTATITARVQDVNGNPILRILDDDTGVEDMTASCIITVVVPASGGGATGGGTTGGGGSAGGGSTGGGGGAGGGGGDTAPAPETPAPSIDFAAAIQAGYNYAISKGWDPSAVYGGSHNAPSVGYSTDDLITKICRTVDVWTAAVGGDPMGSGICIYQYGDGVIVQV